MGRILDINPTYLKFFIKNNDERYLLLQGGRRSGKSISVFQWITFKLLCEKKECCVMCSTYPAAMNAVKDFRLATGMEVTGNQVYGQSCTFPNGSIIYFKAFDIPTKAQGTYCDYAIVEEALNIDEKIFSVFAMSIREQVYFLYNPTRTAWVDRYLAPDKHNYLKTTFKDNPYLQPEQLEEFRIIKEKAQSPTATIWDQYAYQVYYLGNFSEMSGKVFAQIYTCTDEEFDKIPMPPVYGLDFGLVEGRDKTALIAVKVFQGCLYAKELIYSDQLANNKALAFRMAELGLDCYSPIYGDWGGMGKTRMQALITAGDYGWTEPEICRGFNIANARKGKVLDGITKMLQYDRIVLTEGSVNLRREMDNYELTDDGKPKGQDHGIDAFRYAVNSAF